jgi:hypothetical protein
VDQIAVSLTPHKKARVKEVVTFLRRNKKIEKTTKNIEEDFFEEEKEYPYRYLLITADYTHTQILA